VTFEWVADGYFSGQGRFDAPDLWLELDREVQPDGEVAGGDAYGPLEPEPPLLLADGVGVLDRGPVTRIEGKLAVLVGEEQPDLLGGVPVQLQPPLHRLDRAALARVRLQRHLLEGQRVLPVVPVGARRVVRVTVDGDLHQIPGDRLDTGVVEISVDPAAVGLVRVRELRDLLLDDQSGARRHPLHGDGRVPVHRTAPGMPQLVVILEALPEHASGREDGLGPPGEVLRRLVPPTFDMADVRRVESHPGGKLLLRHPALGTPLGERRHELVCGPFDG
jgi:hypothetical protein